MRGMEGRRAVDGVYVDDGQLRWSPDKDGQDGAAVIQDKLSQRFDVKYSEQDPPEDYFLGANRFLSKDRDVLTIRATTYIDSMLERYEIDLAKYPATWSFTPANDDLVKAYEEACLTRTPATSELYTV